MADQTATTCSRCRRLGFECRIDQGFKRERKRKRSDELAKEVDTLKKELSRRSSSAQTSGRTSTDGSASLTYGSDTASTGSLCDYRASSETFATGLPNVGVSTEGTAWPNTPVMSEGNPGIGLSRPRSKIPRSIGSIQLSTNSIDELYHGYFTRLHQSLPVLDPTIGPDQYYESSPLLFWAVIAVASHRYTSQPGLMSQLAHPVTELTWRTLQSAPLSIHVVQSLSLLCTWPIPAISSNADVVNLWTRSMVQIAIQLGLHRSLDPSDLSETRPGISNTEIFERARTWTACNVVARSVSAAATPVAPNQSMYV